MVKKLLKLLLLRLLHLLLLPLLLLLKLLLPHRLLLLPLLLQSDKLNTLEKKPTQVGFFISRISPPSSNLAPIQSLLLIG